MPTKSLRSASILILAVLPPIRAGFPSAAAPNIAAPTAIMQAFEPVLPEPLAAGPAGDLLVAASTPAASASAASGAALSTSTSLNAALDVYGRQLLSGYVTPAGVRYQAWRANAADVKALSEVVTKLSSLDPKTLAPSDRFALYINLYNAKVLEIVLKENPKSTIKEVTPGITGFGVFLKPIVDLDGEKISLRQLEDRLRQESKDPRIHFAINCASRSCPPIAAEPYRGDRLNEQLDRSTRSFLASPGAIVVTPGKSLLGRNTLTVQVSKIFDWYEKDFRATGGPLAFIERYGPPDVVESLKKAGGSARIGYQEYNWSLNTAP